MTTHLTRWTAAGTAVLAMAGIGGGIAAAATSTPAVTAGSPLTAKLLAVTVKGQTSPGTHATGSFTGTLERNDQVSYRITFRGLSGPITGAMLQFGTPGKTTKSLQIVLKSGRSPVKGTITLSAQQAASVRSGKAWLTLQTKRNLTGAVRGRITA